MLFNRIYKYLYSQRLSPYKNAQLRIWWAKNKRNYKQEYLHIMHQIQGANWLNHIQLINIDNYYLKGFFKIVILIMILVLLIYTAI